MQEFNLIDLYNKAFGYNFIAGRYTTGPDKVIVPEGSQFSTKTRPDLKGEWESVIGTPILMPTQIGLYWLPLEPIISMKLSKKIIETELDNVEGTFKEGFTNGDYDITIQGIAVYENSLEPEEMPEQALRTIRKYVEKNSRLPITNKLANMFGVDHIVIYDFDINQVPGEFTAWSYSITAKSDKYIPLIIKPS